MSPDFQIETCFPQKLDHLKPKNLEAYMRIEMKIYTNELGHMTKHAAIRKYVKPFKILFLRNQWIDGFKTWFVALGRYLFIFVLEIIATSGHT